MNNNHVYHLRQENTEGGNPLPSFIVETTEKSEADVPVPDRLYPKDLSRELVNRLKLSQRIGLLIHLAREGLISPGGKERLLYLQSKASFEALEAGLRFSRRLENEVKLQSDFQHELRELNRRPQSKRFRAREKSRIGIGYRDKGTLPEISTGPRSKATEENYIHLESLPGWLQHMLLSYVPTCLEGEWVDLKILSEGAQLLIDELKTLPLLLNQI